MHKCRFRLAASIFFLCVITSCRAVPQAGSSEKNPQIPVDASSSLSCVSDSPGERIDKLPASKGEWFLEDLGPRLYEISFWKNIEPPTDQSDGFISYYLNKNPDAPYVERQDGRYYDRALVKAFLLERFELEFQDLVTCSAGFDPFRAPDPAYVPTLPPAVVSVEQAEELITVRYEIQSEERLISSNKLVIRLLTDGSFRYVSNEVDWKIPRNA